MNCTPAAPRPRWLALPHDLHRRRRGRARDGRGQAGGSTRPWAWTPRAVTALLDTLCARASRWPRQRPARAAGRVPPPRPRAAPARAEGAALRAGDRLHARASVAPADAGRAGAQAGLSLPFPAQLPAHCHATPQQMLMALRLFEAKRRLAAGEPPAQVALAAGLTDQALTRPSPGATARHARALPEADARLRPRIAEQARCRAGAADAVAGMRRQRPRSNLVQDRPLLPPIDWPRFPCLEPE